MKSEHALDILFVEDEVATRENYLEYLELLFQNVYIAEDGEKAYKIYKEKKPDILLVDINIPKLNGIELLKKIRVSDHSTKVIIMSAYSDRDILLDAINLKLTNYLVKPVSRSELQYAIDSVIEELLKFKTIDRSLLALDDEHIWDYQLEKITCKNEDIVLTDKELRVFSLLTSNIDKVFTYEEILNTIWHNFDTNVDVLKTVVKNLRKKLPNGIISNVFGVGYTIEVYKIR